MIFTVIFLYIHYRYYNLCTRRWHVTKSVRLINDVIVLAYNNDSNGVYFKWFISTRLLSVLNLNNSNFVTRQRNKQRELINTIKISEFQYLGRVMRGQIYELLQLIMQRKISDRRSIGRRRISWLTNQRVTVTVTVLTYPEQPFQKLESPL